MRIVGEGTESWTRHVERFKHSTEWEQVNVPSATVYVPLKTHGMPQGLGSKVPRGPQRKESGGGWICMRCGGMQQEGDRYYILSIHFVFA